MTAELVPCEHLVEFLNDQVGLLHEKLAQQRRDAFGGNAGATGMVLDNGLQVNDVRQQVDYDEVAASAAGIRLFLLRAIGASQDVIDRAAADWHRLWNVSLQRKDRGAQVPSDVPHVVDASPSSVLAPAAGGPCKNVPAAGGFPSYGKERSVSNDIDLFSGGDSGEGSPFDAIRRVREDGTEFWSARDLMPLMGYSRWENFETPVRRAMKTAENQAMDVSTLFLRSQEKTGGRPREDFELARYAAYLVAMNGDPNIPEVAEAQHYFAVKTREAETAPQPRFLIPKTYAGALRAAAEQAERAELAEQQKQMLEARIEKDAPLVAKAEAHSKADNAAINRQTFAREVQAWGLKQGITILHEHVYALLRRKGMLIDGQRSDRNHASSQAVKSGWAWTHKDVTPDGHATAVTYLRASGQDLAWKWITAYVAAHGDLRPRAEVPA